MADKSVRYTPEFKRQMVELARTGGSPASLAKEFGPTPDDLSVDQAGCPRRCQGRWRPDERRARGAHATAACEPQAQGKTSTTSGEGPDRLWVADITYIPTWSGFLYLCGHGDASGEGADPLCAGDGTRSASTRGRDPSLRSGLLDRVPGPRPALLELDDGPIRTSVPPYMRSVATAAAGMALAARTAGGRTLALRGAAQTAVSRSQ